MRPRGSSLSNMGRKRLALRKIEDSTARQVTYSKRKDGMIKKANELAVLCDIDVAFIMFSPSGRLTCFSSKKSFSGFCRVEDVFLRFLERPEELKGGSIATELMIRKLRKLKYEAEMMEKMAHIEELQKKLEEFNQRKHDARLKLRHYQPNLEEINSSVGANGHLRFLESALQRIQMARAKLLGKAVLLQGLGDAEGIIPNSEDSAFSVVDESSTPNQYARLQQTSVVDESSTPNQFAGQKQTSVGSESSMANQYAGLQQASGLGESSMTNQYVSLQQARAIGVPAMEFNVDDFLPIRQNMNYLDYMRMAQNQWYMSRSQRGPYPGNL